VADFVAWLERTGLATWTRESGSIWAYPTILTLHTVGLAVVVGANAVVDLRLLGFAPRLPVPSLGPLFRIVWWAFALNAVTGVVLFMSDATIKARQPVFYVKLTVIGLALWNTALVRRAVNREPALREPQITPPHCRRLAITSLLLWLGAITAGRLMAYL
jgi:uncharacterized protein DUF6644